MLNRSIYYIQLQCRMERVNHISIELHRERFSEFYVHQRCTTLPHFKTTAVYLSNGIAQNLLTYARPPHICVYCIIYYIY